MVRVPVRVRISHWLWARHRTPETHGTHRTSNALTHERTQFHNTELRASWVRPHGSISTMFTPSPSIPRTASGMLCSSGSFIGQCSSHICVRVSVCMVECRARNVFAVLVCPLYYVNGFVVWLCMDSGIGVTFDTSMTNTTLTHTRRWYYMAHRVRTTTAIIHMCANDCVRVRGFDRVGGALAPKAGHSMVESRACVSISVQSLSTLHITQPCSISRPTRPDIMCDDGGFFFSPVGFIRVVISGEVEQNWAILHAISSCSRKKRGCMSSISLWCLLCSDDKSSSSLALCVPSLVSHWRAATMKTTKTATTSTGSWTSSSTNLIGFPGDEDNWNCYAWVWTTYLC